MKIQLKLNEGDSKDIGNNKISSENYYHEASQADHKQETVRTVSCTWQWLVVPITLIVILLFSFFLYGLWNYIYYYTLIQLGALPVYEGKKYYSDISWSNCGKYDYGKLNALTINPNPIDITKNLSLFAEAEVYRNVDSPLSVKIHLEKKVWFHWLTIPCIKSLGSCTIKDICQFSPYLHNATCVLPLPKSYLPCNCPIKKGKYYAHNSEIEVEDATDYVPKWLMNGKYWIQIKGFAGATELACYQFYFAVTS